MKRDKNAIQQTNPPQYPTIKEAQVNRRRFLEIISGSAAAAMAMLIGCEDEIDPMDRRTAGVPMRPNPPLPPDLPPSFAPPPPETPVNEVAPNTDRPRTKGKVSPTHADWRKKEPLNAEEVDPTAADSRPKRPKRKQLSRHEQMRRRGAPPKPRSAER